MIQQLCDALLKAARARPKLVMALLTARPLHLSSAPHTPTSPTSGVKRQRSEALGYSDLRSLLEGLKLGFSPGQLTSAIRSIDKGRTGSVPLQQLVDQLGLRDVLAVAESSLARKSLAQELEDAERVSQRHAWVCGNCTFINEGTVTSCAACELDSLGQRSCPPDKWVCLVTEGGCSFFNRRSLFYCEVCSRARPDLRSVRL